MGPIAGSCQFSPAASGHSNLASIIRRRPPPGCRNIAVVRPPGDVNIFCYTQLGKPKFRQTDMLSIRSLRPLTAKPVDTIDLSRNTMRQAESAQDAIGAVGRKWRSWHELLAIGGSRTALPADRFQNCSGNKSDSAIRPRHVTLPEEQFPRVIPDGALRPNGRGSARKPAPHLRPASAARGAELDAHSAGCKRDRPSWVLGRTGQGR